MDISKEYIEMCEKAREIQIFRRTAKREKTSIPDLFARKTDGKISYTIPSEIWLPRQDQLQEMIRKRLMSCNISFNHDYMIMKMSSENYLPEKWIVGDSFEQCWLQAIMREKYNKVWKRDTKEWIKIGFQNAFSNSHQYDELNKKSFKFHYSDPSV